MRRLHEEKLRAILRMGLVSGLRVGNELQHDANWHRVPTTGPRRKANKKAALLCGLQTRERAAKSLAAFENELSRVSAPHVVLTAEQFVNTAFGNLVRFPKAG